LLLLLLLCCCYCSSSSFALVAGVSSCRVRSKNGMGAWSGFSHQSQPVFLRAAHGERPMREPVRGLVLGHTGGGYVASSSEIRRFIRESVEADTRFDAEMVKWLKDQGWGALRVWARRCARMTAAQKAAEAFRLTQPPAPRGAGLVGDSKAQPSAGTPTTEALRGKVGRAYDKHVSPWLARSRAEWVRVAETAAAGRPSLLREIPGSHMYRRLTRGRSMRRQAKVRQHKGTSVSHGGPQQMLQPSGRVPGQPTRHYG